MPDDLLLLDFARRDPAGFAAALEGASPGDTMLVLRGLPAPVAVSVASRLAQSQLNTLVAEHQEQLCRWLESVEPDLAIALVSRLPRDRGIRLVSSLTNQKLRRSVLRFLRYPLHCVGGLVPMTTVQVPSRTPVLNVIAELQELGTGSEVPVVLLDHDGRFCGKLDLWRLLLAGLGQGQAGDYLLRTPVLYPETPLTSARQLLAWDDHDWLPVVGHDQRVLGSVSRKRVFGAAGRLEPHASLSAESMINLGEQFLRVARDLLGQISAAKPS